MDTDLKNWKKENAKKNLRCPFLSISVSKAMNNNRRERQENCLHSPAIHSTEHSKNHGTYSNTRKILIQMNELSTGWTLQCKIHHDTLDSL